ncbi:MAG: TonB-dependent receptor [Caulobacterales bacterium]|uniref:TonB-dependent receptor n=1 Tax=Glycocaulis sp. TaxID=1969725 RepID=UPI003FA12463
MKMKLRTFGAAAALAGVSPLAFMTPAALAQEEGASANREVIVVTARRTEESLQDVPGAVSAFSEAALERIDVTDSTGLQGSVPNLNIVQGRGSSNATNIYIRGVGQPDALQTFDPAVGFYVDDVYYSRIRGTQLDLFDIERIEVLRGPQGTLYGKNTIGGALRVITRRPDQETRGQFQVGVGNYSLWDARASVSGGLAENLAGSVALFGTGRDGYVTNPNTGEEYNDRNATAARVALAWDAAPGFTVDWNADWSRENNALTMGQPINTLTTLFGVPIVTLPAQVPPYNFTGVATPGLPNSSEMTHWGSALTMNWELSDTLTLRSITAYRELEYEDYVDIDATALETGDVLVAVDQDQISQEFQLNYEGERLTVVSGLFYMIEDIQSHQEAFADDLLTGPGGFTFLRTIDDDLETRSWALYANATFDLTDRLSVSAGIRYTDEQKDYFRTTSTFSTFPGLTVDPALAFRIEESWTNTSPMVSLDYRFSDNVLFYGRVSQGFKSGGFNGRANNPGEQAPYDPETVTSYELGVKTDWMDNTLRANFTVFYNDYEDFQARVSGLAIDPGTGLPSPELTVLNAGSLEISGFEVELAYNPVPELLLDAQIGYLDAAYGEFADARFTNFGGSRAFQDPAFSPEWTSRFGASYEFDLAENGSLRLSGSARYRSRMALAVDNTPVNSNVEIEGLYQDAYWLYDANAVWTNRDGNYSVGLYGRNLADEVYRTDGQEFSSVGNIRTVYYGAPRTWRLVFTARY